MRISDWSSDVCSSDLVEVAPQPVDDLSDPGALALALGRAQRGIGGEEDGIAQLNGGTLPVMRERDDVALGATEGGPVAHRVLDQLVGLGDPERPAPALEPVVEDDPGDMPALAGPVAVAPEPADPEAHGACRPGVDRKSTRRN